MKLARKREESLGRLELLAIALGGMIGGGIFAILGVSVANIGNLTPFAIALGGGMAFVAAYSYVQLAKLYEDEGATYSFFKRTFPHSHLAASAIGWIVTLGYVSTLALYAFTFGSYLTSAFHFEDPILASRISAGVVLTVFAVINLVSVRGMGRAEDLMVYTKLVFLALISVVLVSNGSVDNLRPLIAPDATVSLVVMTAAVTFVAFEGFQLAIHATGETARPGRDIPWAIYTAVLVATLIYVLMATGALMALSKSEIVQNQEFALAAGAAEAIGNLGRFLVIAGALLATSSAISGTIFGASRLLAVIAADGFFPTRFAHRRHGHIPGYAIVVMTIAALSFIFLGRLEEILQFGSITFILVSLLMALANFVKRRETRTHPILTLGSIVILGSAAVAILIYQWQTNRRALAVTMGLYLIVFSAAFVFSRRKTRRGKDHGAVE